MLADEFARSQERREVRYKAQQVNMGSLSCENFFQLCKELFCKVILVFFSISEIRFEISRE